MRYRAALSWVLAALAVCVFGARSVADAHTYASVRRQVRAGIIVTSALNMPGNQGPENPDPHIFYVLDRRTDLKPRGLEFVNPLAPPVITGEIHERWRRRDRGNDPAFRPGNPLYEMFRVGARVTKNMGAYWEVNVDALEAEQLREFDILLLHTHKADVVLMPEVLEKLRAFVESGGTLWVDQCGGFTFNRYAPFFYGIQYRSGGAPGGSGQAGAVIGSPNHPLVSYPYQLTPQEVRTLGDKNVGGWYIYYPYDPNDPSYYDPSAGKNNLNPPAPETLVPVVWNTRGFPSGPNGQPNPNWRPYVLAGAVGAGKLIVMAQDTGCAINDYVGGVQVGSGGNCGAISGENMLAAKPQDLKFAYNLALWATAHRTAHADPRRSGASFEGAPAQLDEKWSAPGSGPGRVGGAAFLRQCVYAVGGDLVLRCFDANPANDLDGDGNPDDGLTDLSAGASFDCIWAFDLKAYGPITGASTPTVIEFFDGNAPSAPGLVTSPNRELVVVVLSNGTVVAVRALPVTIRNVNGVPYAALADFTVADWVIPPANSGAQDFGLAPTEPIPAAAFSEGVLFVALNTSSGGRVMAIDPATGGSPFLLGQPAGTNAGLVPDAPGTEALRSAPTVGYVKDDLTGATDKMVYINVNPRSGQPASVRAIPFSVKGEPLNVVSVPDRIFRSRARVPWYIYRGPGSNPALRPRVVCVYRSPVDGAVGMRELEYTPADPPGNNQWHERFDMGEARVRIGASIELTNVELPDGTRAGMRTVTPTTDGVTFLADYTYDWAPDPGSTLPRVNARSVFVAPDPTDTNNFITGAVALSRRGLIYFNGRASSESETYPGRSAVIAVKEQGSNQSRVQWTYALYDGFQMTVNGSAVRVPPRLRRADGVFLTKMRFLGAPAVHNDTVYAVASGLAGGQPVSVLCAFKAAPEFVLRLDTRIDQSARVRVRQPNLFVDRGSQTEAWIELAAGQYTVDYDSGIIRITSMAPPGAVAAAYVTASAPFVVQIGTGPEQVSIPSRADSDGVRRGGPDGVDNLLWFCVLPGPASSSPSVMGDVVWVGLADGSVVSVDADPTIRNPEYQMTGAEVAYRWVTPPLSAPGDPMPAAPVVMPPSSGGEVLAVATGSGVFALEDTVTLIADSSRLLEVNSAGEAVWSCEGTRAFDIANGPLTDYTDPNNPIVGTGVPVGQTVPFRRPLVARKLGSGDILVVDTGNNRVLVMDRGGYVRWEVSRFQDDYKRLLRSGDPLSLNEPTDCSFWVEYQPSLNISGGSYSYNGPGYVYHYLIADSGNYRVVEIIDVISASGEPVLVRQLNYVSSTYAQQGKRYRYRSVQRIVMRNSDLPASPAYWRENPYNPSGPPLDLRYLTVATVSNARMVDRNMPMAATVGGGESMEGGGGSVAILRETGDPLAVVANLRIPEDTGGSLVVRLQPIVAPTWFSSFQEMEGGALVTKFLLADANGVYQVRLNFIEHPDNSPPYVEPVLDVEWLLTAADYYAMTGKRLQASSVVRLTASAENPAFPSLRQYLIANRFNGEDAPSVFGETVNVTSSSAFKGEVFIIKPSTFHFGPGHGYVRDYSVIPSPVGSFLWPNDGGTYVINGVVQQMPRASIIRRVPSESVPRPPYAVLHRVGDTNTSFAGDPPGAIRRYIGDQSRGTWTSVLEQPAYADRPF